MALRRCDAYVSSLTEQQEVQVNRNIPAVSVIIPVYNVEAYLEQCVDSVLSQSFDDFEIILVDDESPDGSGEICERYAASDTRVSVVHKKNGGLGYARNTGLEKAVGRYVFFLDSDDYLPADALERLYALAVATRQIFRHCQGWGCKSYQGQRCLEAFCLMLFFYGRRISRHSVCCRGVGVRRFVRQSLSEAKQTAFSE